MNQIVEFLIHHGYSFLFFWVLGEQAGLPIPSAPVLLAAGALAGRGRMNLPIVVATALIAATICDTLWYILGRQRGSAVARCCGSSAASPWNRILVCAAREFRSNAGALGRW